MRVRTRTEKSWRTASKDQVSQEVPSTSTGLLDSKKTAGTQIYLCFIEPFYASYTYKFLERKVKCASHGCSGCYVINNFPAEAEAW